LNFGRNLLNFEFENEIYRKIPKFRIPVTSGNEKFSEISAKLLTLLGTSRPPQGRSEERRTGPRPRASHCDDCSEARRTGCGREAAGELLPPV